MILVRRFAEADDVASFHAAKGILTSEGGKASHAALVARGMGVPAVTGAAVVVDVGAQTLRVNGHVLGAGDRIGIDGSAGAVVEHDAQLIDAAVNPCFERVLEWADEVRRLGVRTSADTPENAVRARSLGAEGIGLCRTEHMFMAAARQPKMRAMILADDDAGRRDALAELLPYQQQDFAFLPNLAELSAQVERARIAANERLPELELLLARTEAIAEENPMLGTRGSGLGMLFPEIYEMQLHAMMLAANEMDQPPQLEIMIPLVDYEMIG